MGSVGSANRCGGLGAPGLRAWTARGRRVRALAGWVAMVSVGGCAKEEIVNYRPALLGSLPEARSQTSMRLDTGRVRPGTNDGVTEEGKFDPSLLRRERDDGSVTLIARRPYHLMVHVYYTLINGEEALFTEQVLSKMTRDEFTSRGFEAREGYDLLQERQSDVLRLFAAMPQGELTPGVLMEKVGDGVYRLEAVGSRARGLRWRFMDVVMEGGHWRLRWFGS